VVLSVSCLTRIQAVRVNFLHAAQRGTGVPPVNPHGQDARATPKNRILQGGILSGQVEYFSILSKNVDYSMYQANRNKKACKALIDKAIRQH